MANDPKNRTPLEVVCGLVFDQKDRLLLCRRMKGELKGYWEFPGGKRENESAEEALRRELLEELGLDVAVEEYFMDSVHSYPTISIRLMAYRCRAMGSIGKMTDHDAIKWIHPKDIDTFRLAPADVPIAEELLRNIQPSIDPQ